MRFLDEYREAEAARKLAAAIARTVTRPWTLMEVCGGQTHAIMRYGLAQLLPPGLELVHGPGCPVCVTPLSMIDLAHAIAERPGVIFCSFGDMLRVPGSNGDFLALKAKGADIRVIYSPLDAVRLAAEQPDREVVFFAIGFETTAPANAMAAWLARRQGLRNFSLLVSHVLVPPSISYILETPGNRVQALLGPGHVCTITGLEPYAALAGQHGVPIVVSGFEPVDLLEGIFMAVRQLERGEARLENQYARVVRPEGNPNSRRLIEEVFEVCDQAWRGMGTIAGSGLRLRSKFRDFDAAARFDRHESEACESSVCMSGEIFKGLKKPFDCPAFARQCTPHSPLGATMVSSEGACAAYYSYGRAQEVQP